MNIYYEDKIIDKHKETVVTIGTFDGIHRGHQKILKKVIDLGNQNNWRTFVITFQPHPRKVISKDYNMKLLTTIDEKKELFEYYGIDNLLIINFTKEFSQMSSKEFVKKIICDKIGAKHIVVGYDHKFGKDRGGNEDQLRMLGEKLDFEVTRVNPISIGENVISSTKIRNLLLAGKIKKANEFLGRKYSLKGIVIKGAGRGRSLGYPTANLNVNNPDKLIPLRGVYAVNIIFESVKYLGVMNIGFRPTFNQTTNLILEAHIIGFYQDIYGNELKIEFLERLRDEKKFNSKEELKKQIELDKEKTINLSKEILTN